MLTEPWNVRAHHLALLKWNRIWWRSSASPGILNVASTTLVTAPLPKITGCSKLIGAEYASMGSGSGERKAYPALFSTTLGRPQWFLWLHMKENRVQKRKQKIQSWPRGHDTKRRCLPGRNGQRKMCMHSTLTVFLKMGRTQWAACHLRKTTDRIYIETAYQQRPPAVMEPDQVREYQRCLYTTDVGGYEWRSLPPLCPSSLLFFPLLIFLLFSIDILARENVKDWFVESWTEVCVWMGVGDYVTRVGMEEYGRRQDRYSWCHSDSLRGETARPGPTVLGFSIWIGVLTLL